MTSSASFLILALLLSSSSGRGGSDAPIAPAMEALVRDSIAGIWQVDPAFVQLDWGRTSLSSGRRLNGPVRVAGGGRDGRFVVLFGGGNSPEASAVVRAGVAETLMVARRAVPQGAVIGPDEIEPVVRIRYGARPVRARPLARPGWVARRSLGAGDPLVWPSVVPPTLFETGDPVRLEWRRGAVTVTGEGTALNGAAMGERVRVRILHGGRTILGFATSPGTVVPNRRGN